MRLRPGWPDLERTTIRVPGRAVRSIAFDRDGARATIFAPNGYVGFIGVVDLHRGEPRESKQIRVRREILDGVPLSPDAKRLAISEWLDETVIWNLEDDSEKLSVPVRYLQYAGPELGGAVDFSDIAFSPDGRRFAVVDIHGKMFLIDSHNGKPQSSFDFGISQFKFLPDGETLILWNRSVLSRGKLATREIINVEPVGHRLIETVAISDNGRLIATGGNEGTILLWNSAIMKTIGTLSGHRSSVTSLAFSPDGSVLASQSHEDRTVRLWDIASCEELGTLDEASGSRLKLAFSPDGLTLVGLTYGEAYSMRPDNKRHSQCEITLWRASQVRKRPPD